MTSIMLSEILSQPEAVANTISHARSFSSQVQELVSRKKINNIIFFARGTSDNVAQYGYYLFATCCGLSATSGHPSLATAYQARLSLENTLAIGISQSGSTIEIVESLRWAKSSGATTLSITNTAASPIYSVSDITIQTQAGNEIAVPATKTFTSALTALAVVAEAINKESFSADAIDALPDLIEKSLTQQNVIDEIASTLKPHKSAVVTGRGFSVAIANEIALKFQESCYLVSLGLSAADLQHGPKAIVDHQVPIIAFAAGKTSPVNSMMVDLVSKLQDRAASIVVIGPEDCGVTGNHQIFVPSIQESLIPILMAPPSQMMVEATARAKGLNPDTPRGLTKVTQT